MRRVVIGEVCTVNLCQDQLISSVTRVTTRRVRMQIVHVCAKTPLCFVKPQLLQVIIPAPQQAGFGCFYRIVSNQIDMRIILVSTFQIFHTCWCKTKEFNLLPGQN